MNIKKKILSIALAVAVLGGVSAFALQTATKDITVNYGIKLEIDGEQKVLTDAAGNIVEPFAYNGTTYVPIRAIAEHFGADVSYDSTTGTASVVRPNDSLTIVRMMGFYKAAEEGLSRLHNTFERMETDIQWLMDAKISDKKTLLAAAVQTESSFLALIEGHFEDCRDSLSSEGVALMSEYRRLAGLSISYCEELDKDNPSSVFVGRVVGSATQNRIDCQMAGLEASTLFWQAYQAAFAGSATAIIDAGLTAKDAAGIALHSLTAMNCYKDIKSLGDRAWELQSRTTGTLPYVGRINQDDLLESITKLSTEDIPSLDLHVREMELAIKGLRETTDSDLLRDSLEDASLYLESLRLAIGDMTHAVISLTLYSSTRSQDAYDSIFEHNTAAYLAIDKVILGSEAQYDFLYGLTRGIIEGIAN